MQELLSLWNRILSSLGVCILLSTQKLIRSCQVFGEFNKQYLFPLPSGWWVELKVLTFQSFGLSGDQPHPEAI